MNRSRLWRGVLFTIASYIGLLLPIGGLFYLNRDTYFVQSQAGDKLSLGAMIALLYTIAMIRGTFNEIDKRVKTFITMGVFLAVVWFMDSIIKDLFWIILSSMIGYGIFTPLSILANRDITYMKTYKEETIKIQARKDAAEVGNV